MTKYKAVQNVWGRVQSDKKKNVRRIYLSVNGEKKQLGKSY